MKTAIASLLFFILQGSVQVNVFCQPVVDFTLPDSICVGSPVSAINLTTGGTTYYWNFCSGNVNNDPFGVNIGNPGNLLDVPTYMTLVQDGNKFYSFISNQFAGIIRYDHGSTFSHNPVSSTNLGTFGLLGIHVEGIKIKKDNGNWYGFVCNETTIIRMDFGSSLANTPTAVDIGPVPGLIFAHGLEIIKEGNTWLGFISDTTGDSFFRLNFGATLGSVPTVQNFPNYGLHRTAGPICTVQENSLWYMIIQGGYNDLTRLSFGNSLMNPPAGENLGNPGGLNTHIGLAILRDCESTGGYFLNYLDNGQLGKLTFTGGITGTVTGQVLGNIGNLNRPHCFSEIFRQNDTLFTYVTNRGSSTLTRLTFPPCNNSSVPSSSLYDPPPFSYNSPGTYTVRLLVNEGLPDQVSLCKTIVIRKLTYNSFDTTICYGTKYYAGGEFRSAAGVYTDTVKTSSGYDSVIITNLTIKPRIPVDLGGSRSICPGESIKLAATVNGAAYCWQDSSSDSIFIVTDPGLYWVRVTYDHCSETDSVQITECPDELWFPSAFSPNGDGLNDFFRPKGINIARFNMKIYSRWGNLICETDDMERGWDGSLEGVLCAAGTYTFVATYEGTDSPGKSKRKKGSVILLR
jgi:gliding motility-associated-like protein